MQKKSEHFLKLFSVWDVRATYKLNFYGVLSSFDIRIDLFVRLVPSTIQSEQTANYSCSSY